MLVCKIFLANHLFGEINGKLAIYCADIINSNIVAMQQYDTVQANLIIDCKFGDETRIFCLYISTN